MCTLHEDLHAFMCVEVTLIPCENPQPDGARQPAHATSWGHTLLMN
jgi:hypothetical protein